MIYDPLFLIILLLIFLVVGMPGWVFVLLVILLVLDVGWRANGYRNRPRF